MRLPPVLELVFVATIFCLGVGLGREFMAAAAGNTSEGLAWANDRLRHVVENGCAADDVLARTVFEQTQPGLTDDLRILGE